jgi:hypothetical protein
VSLPTQLKGVPFWGLLGCALLVVGVGCDRYDEKSVMPTARGIPASVTLVEHGVGLLTGSDKGQPCHELRLAAGVKGDASDMFAYSCIQSQDQLSTSLLIADGTQLAVGGAVAPSVATVTVNGQPAPRDGQYFLAVLPTIPDSGVNVVASDKDGRVVSSEEHSKALITSPRIPSQTSPPPKS